MRILLWIWILSCFFLPCSGGIILNSGLDLQGGKECLEMQAGEKLYLIATHSVWKYPVLHGLEYSSKYPLIATVDEGGLVRALFPGRTVISVWNEAGDNATIEIIVHTKTKYKWLLFFAFVLLLVLSIMVLKKKRICVF